ncbi:MAG: LysR family transcriptional regulator [Clostridia bacterium]|nr:LysR family transcriptional regulator [Clostridia bacterium]
MANKLRYTLSLRVFGEEKIFGPGIAELLERVDETHSLRKATMDMGMAYSKAWRIVKTAENALGFPLLDSAAGGKGGGGAVLTERGRRFLTAYRTFESVVHAYADEAFEELFGEDSD